jgi:O-antigen biosynthesis protein
MGAGGAYAPAVSGAPAPATGGAPPPATGGAPAPATGGAPPPATGGAHAPATGGAPPPATGGPHARATGGGPGPASEPGTGPASGARPLVVGKSLFVGAHKLIIHGVTYGPLGPPGEDDGWSERVARADFAAMRAAGVDTIRVYTVPPRWLLDAALEQDLWVMVGVPWEQHVAFLDEGLADEIASRVAEGVRTCAGHPALLAIAVGNEIPASIVRGLGRRRVERFLRRLFRVASEQAPGTLLTYVNYPGTEYLRVPDADFLAFNVYLEQRERLEAYLARLQNLADDRPLVLAELGLDSRRNGEQAQAGAIGWQLECAFAAGCAGAFVFAWTDEWHRGGQAILDWDFGLTRRDRAPKPALGEVRRVFRARGEVDGESSPTVSVVVCTFNGAATLADTLDGATGLRYPHYEVIVVDDGSSDSSAQIGEAFGVRVIRTENRGLSAARNRGAEAAAGEIVAYLDDDARPDPDWLTHLAAAFSDPRVGAAGGPNILPARSEPTAACVANAPGGPTHVLLSDRDAEHLPGCNLALRCSALLEIGGFDERFRVAGDDVDVCWRLADRGYRLAFSPGAVVLHRRRASVRAYLRQQRGYGRAEALLERKWPERYGPGGHVDWRGRLYGNGSAQHRGGWRWRVYYGAWGTASYQSLYGPARGILESLPLLPEWYLLMAILAAASVGGLAWPPLLLALPGLMVALLALLIDAALGAARARFPAAHRTRRRALRMLTALLYLLQPTARLSGRLTGGLVPWRRRGPRAFRVPLPATVRQWSEMWASPEDRVRELSARLAQMRAVVRSGGDWDRWDLQIRGGGFGRARLRITVEEHGQGSQLIRVHRWPSLAPAGVVALVAILAAIPLTLLAGTPLLAAPAVALLLRLLYECGNATRVLELALSDAQAPVRPGVRLELSRAEARL